MGDWDTNMQLEITLRDLFYLLSPVGCRVEAVLIALLFTAICGCFVSALL
jgi:hypothetical protein